MNAQRRAVRDIVERVRAGDQVAMALMAEARDNALKGNPTAITSVKLFEQYIKTHPPVDMGAAAFGNQTELSVDTNPQAAAALWASTGASPDEFSAMVIKTSPVISIWQAIVAIAHGPKLDANNPLMQVVNVKNSRLAGIVRRAAKLQWLQLPEVAISSYCPTTGWELGE